MSGSVGTQVSASSSRTFLRIMAGVSLALALAEFLLAVHYHSQWIAAGTEKTVIEEFRTLYYSSAIWANTRWLAYDQSRRRPTTGACKRLSANSAPTTLSKPAQ